MNEKMRRYVMGRMLGKFGVPIMLAKKTPWETIFEETVEATKKTSFISGKVYYSAVIDIIQEFEFDGYVRLTVDGVSHIYPIEWRNSRADAGNLWLSDPENYTDDGCDMYFSVYDSNSSPITRFRAEGTYAVKIEISVSQKIIGYSYNGVVMAKRPHSSAEYQFIEYTGDAAVLYTVTDPFGSYGTKMGPSPDFSSYVYNSCYLRKNGTNIEKPAFDGNNLDPRKVDPQKVLWANYDVPDYVNGGVFLTASEPVPVYE